MLGDTEDEYRRLLYVAMTRAADRLIVGGCMPGNTNTVREASWYDLIRKGSPIPACNCRRSRPRRHGEALSRGRRMPHRLPATARADRSRRIELPPWLRSAGRAGNARRHPLRPSDPADDDSHRVRAGESLALRARALQRGTLVHRLLQSLPDIAPIAAATPRWPISPAMPTDWTEDEREALAAQVLALIADPRLRRCSRPAAGPRCRSSAGWTRPGEPPALVSGQIDRLVVTPDEVLIVDYKTNHAPPQTPPRRPRGYVRQLALYRAVLRKLYPGTAGPRRAALDRNA